MKFFEHVAKKLFKDNGIRILRGQVAYTPEEAVEVATELGGPVALKAQVLVGGRGKAGGIQFADAPGEVYTLADELLNSNIKGVRVKHLLVEEKADIEKEFYVSVSYDRNVKKPLIMASSEGGVEIENLAKTNPEKIIKYYVNPLDEFLPYEAREIARKMGVSSNLVSDVGNTIFKLYNIFQKYDAEIVEVNPLILTPNGLYAADAKLMVENDAAFRHKDLLELTGHEPKQFSFVKLDGDIAVLGNGAGLTLTAMDMINLYGGKPATFLDIGGGSSEETIKKALNLVLNYPPVKTVFLNVLGGITRADDVAKGVIDALKISKREIPIVIRLTGTNEEEGQKILEEAGIPFETSMEKAAEKAVEICKSLE
ncbi:ADP-forming succinate--CoA ligase subunit beta [Methanobrevibacter wolinii]|uniref:ADP-forming succinate--CoA ligase subunit beta n=1 Tax=Methanobrevibacter wolinii TaxID=190977 RepID=UPI0005B285D6|nr:ADP-forming succinate--CoA ligase subunit beta [Methanobrevibacter wolinii]